MPPGKQSRRRAIGIGILVAMVVLSQTRYARAQDPQLRFGANVPMAVETIYDKGLSWLVANQNADGSWGARGNTAGIDGMCVMAMLAVGEDPNFGKYSENIRRATASIIAGQDASTGYMGGSMYHHGFATLGLSEVYGVLDESRLWEGVNANSQRTIGEALELAVRCAVTSQQSNQWKAWRYSPGANDADTSVAGAVLMGLLAARNAGIAVPDESIDGAIEYFQKMTTSRGDVGYSGIGGGNSPNLPAIATLVYSIGKRKELPQYKATLGRVQENLESSSPYPFYFRYYMAQALFQGDFDAWDRWNQKTIRELKDQQAEDGSFNGSHGQAYATAMSMLALALNYRFLPIYER
ncbi:MAG: squalene--hopene cyclase [Pirellulaceae bacterium]